MRRIILATASAIALGIAAGPIYAQSNATTPAPAAPSATAPASGTAQPSATQPGMTQPGMPSANSGADINQPNTAGATPPAADTASASPSDIRQAQEKLRQSHLYRGRIDGLLGPETQQAVQRYQQKNGLPVTATLDQATMSSLLGADSGQGSSMPPNPSSGAMPPNGAGTPDNGNPNSGK
jgi:peptidoglycan hydrolase-like protein with peptidoglycan-binding domain